MKEIIPDMPAQWVPPTGSDEIDLREIVLVLWRKKLFILLVASVFGVVGVTYAILVPQVWSANAVIQVPENKDLLPMLRAASQAKLLGVTDFPDRSTLYNEFIREFNAYENRRDFLKGSELFKSQVDLAQLDERGQRLWVREWAKFIAAEAVDKKGEKPGIRLTSSADNPSQALTMLERYMQFIIAKQQQRLVSDLTEQQSMQLDTMMTNLKLTKEDAERALKREIESTVLTISVANAAGVERPLENYNNGERFPITLGTKGLEAKLKVLKAIDLNVYEPKLVELQVKIDRLKQVKLDDISFRPFSYLDAPEEPLSRDKPKRAMIVVLATLLGGMLGVGIVLVRHAFRRPEQA
ncbi:LPS O-antigen chain length determinant protein WzzB [Aeromonas salmonicida]|uniref:LPS O-antigen chain length determinant protein WzzB n=1 Tax=Aeromonas salmonicida TaxID=645 RepID=UPI00259EF8C1|nr:Wzz/FepE/Etk N-terminal domain-containing protein [Aeromonas salmonicida]MDM5112681.1 Wzz/FepE/Etk N-terminal domain-containing protein [Aeromonas salmonicida]